MANMQVIMKRVNKNLITAQLLLPLGINSAPIYWPKTHKINPNFAPCYKQ